LTPQEWAAYLVRAFKADNPSASSAVCEALEKEALSMLKRNGVSKLHSGFVTLSPEKNSSAIAHGDLKKQEDVLALADRGQALESPLLRKLKVIGPDSLEPMGNRSTRVYFAPEMPGGEVVFSEVFYRRPLIGGCTVMVGTESAGIFKYSVRDSEGRCFESGDVFGAEGKFAARYENVLSSIEQPDPQELLKAYKVSYRRTFPPEMLNPILGAHYSDPSLLVELIPAIDAVKISRSKITTVLFPGLDGFIQHSLLSELDRVSITDPRCLKLLKALKEADAELPEF